MKKLITIQCKNTSYKIAGNDIDAAREQLNAAGIKYDRIYWDNMIPNGLDYVAWSVDDLRKEIK